ncbi:hypothetical protein HPB47_018692 [Ixodes persulcatus]|uniref:Uncharacterized protein n=1 Tax=Ixodes persulcatus TaxID=34615 RepID=A0AC60QKA2_IXOPE|nr:hypothetical protein HPB47_018692 [Ixodes persulcatus]
MISRKDWEPNTTSNYSVVCSKHFVSSDFKENTKIRQLKKGAVPSVFAGYPSYMCSAPPKQRRGESSRKRALQPDDDKNRTVKRMRKTTADTGDVHLVDCTVDSVRASVCDEHVQLTVTSAYEPNTFMDVSNSQQHIHKNDPDNRHFSDIDDARLTWLETTFLDYLTKLKNKSHPDNFLSKETHHALVLTTRSNAECIRFLLNEKKFNFVLTRKFSSDPIEALFGFLRRTAGCNDAMDMKSVLCGLEKMLKTGIVSSSKQSNVNYSASFCGTSGVSSDKTANDSHPNKRFFPPAAEQRLRGMCSMPGQWLPNPEVAAIALIVGYLARVMTEKLNCQDCVERVEKAKGNAPVDGLIAHQDRGGTEIPHERAGFSADGPQEVC